MKIILDTNEVDNTKTISEIKEGITNKFKETITQLRFIGSQEENKPFLSSSIKRDFLELADFIDGVLDGDNT